MPSRVPASTCKMLTDASGSEHRSVDRLFANGGITVHLAVEAAFIVSRRRQTSGKYSLKLASSPPSTLFCGLERSPAPPVVGSRGCAFRVDPPVPAIWGAGTPIEQGSEDRDRHDEQGPPVSPDETAESLCRWLRSLYHLSHRTTTRAVRHQRRRAALLPCVAPSSDFPFLP